jgi:predicted enzyme related to lactoylglutathione lyase
MEGQLVHFELPAEDAGRAKEFWKSLFGWKFREWSGPVEYHMLDGNEPGGAIYPSEQPGTGPIVYFGTGDIDKAIARARELGGSADDKQPIPGIGWFARCRDTEGNAFSLFQTDESVPPPGGGGQPG